MIDALPVAPLPVNSPAEFDANAFNFLAALVTFRNQANSTALEVQNNADITAALALSMALPNYGGTSTTSLAIGTGAKSFVTQSGKSWTVGQVVVASNGANYMKGTVTSYSGTALGVNVTSVVGSGTFGSWTIGLSYTSLGLAPRAPRVDVATVAGTVDLTTAAPDTDDIQFTGNNAMTGFTAKAGRVFRFVVATGDTPSLVNGANLKTQTGANVQLAAGDSGMLRVVTDNVVELLNYSRKPDAVLAQTFGGTGTALATRQLAQVVTYQTGAVISNVAAQIPFDDSIPQITEGDQYMTLAITPKSASSELEIEVDFFYTTSSGDAVTAALFQDSTANALTAGSDIASSGLMQHVHLKHFMTAGTTSATTFKVRAGGNASLTITFNGVSGARRLGGVMGSRITIKEWLP